MRKGAAIRGWARSRAPSRGALKADAVAAVPSSIANVPDGMATAVLAGVNPIHGLYASCAGPLVGGAVSSSQRMMIVTTTASGLAAGSALAHTRPADRPGALALLTVMTGGVMIAAGLLRLGRLTRFVSFSVMIGFLSGVAVNVICGELPGLAGAPSVGRTAIQKAWNLLTHPDRIDGASLAVGGFALAIAVVMSRTRFATFS